MHGPSALDVLVGALGGGQPGARGGGPAARGVEDAGDRHAADEAGVRGVPHGGELSRGGLDHLGFTPPDEVPVRDPSGPVRRRGSGVAAQPDRDVPGGTGRDADVVETEPGGGERLAGPGRAQGRDEGLEADPAGGRVDPEGAVLVLGIAEAEPQDSAGHRRAGRRRRRPSAIRSGWCSGARRTPVPSSMRRVTGARAASNVNGDGRYPSGMPWCSVTQKESNPASSAATARPTASRGSPSCPLQSPTPIRRTALTA